jgi:uncharacterized protein YjbI with pentapeptide repeats
MPRRRSASDHSIQPPALPAQLEPAVPDDTLADGGHFTQCALLDSHFDGQSADDVLFEQVVGKRVSLNQANLSLAQLFDVRLEACDLASSEWEKAHLRRAELDGCRLVGLRLSDARIEDVLFHKCNGDLVRVWSSVCKGVCFDQCTLREASFDGTDLSGVIFRRCDLSNADFRGTKLRGADLRGSTLEGMQVGIKELQGAIVDTAQAVRLAGLLGITVRDQE